MARKRGCPSCLLHASVPVTEKNSLWFVKTFRHAKQEAICGHRLLDRVGVLSPQSNKSITTGGNQKKATLAPTSTP